MHASPTTDTPRPARVERFDVVVIGGGQAGLAVGHHLAARDLDFVILDAGRRVGDVWRRRWDSLRLFTPAAYSGLPGMEFPASPGHLPDRDEMADYLERYAERFDLPVRSDTHVDAMAWDGERWAVQAGERRFEADSVIVATGAFQRPRIPALAARLAPPVALPADSGRAVGVRQALDAEFACTGRYSDAGPDDCAELRFAVTEGEELVRAYKMPSLRNVAERAPYMHAGQQATLGDVIAHYDRAPAAPAGHSELRPLRLSATERRQLEAFLRTLSGPLAAPPGFLAPPDSARRADGPR